MNNLHEGTSLSTISPLIILKAVVRRADQRKSATCMYRTRHFNSGILQEAYRQRKDQRMMSYIQISHYAFSGRKEKQKQNAAPHT